MSLSLRMKSAVRGALSQVGIQVVPVRSPLTNLCAYRRAIMMRYHHIDTVIDVGANLGQYAGELREWGFDGRILSIEPTSAAYPTLEKKSKADPKWQCLNFAAGAEEEVAEIAVASNAGASSSLLPMLDSHRRCDPTITNVGIEQIDVKRLDTAIRPFVSSQDRLMLKIDVQGVEDQVLRGSTGIMDQVHLIECELSIIELYQGQLLMPKMIELFDSLGFQMVFAWPGFTYKVSGHTLQIDGTFARKEEVQFE